MKTSKRGLNQRSASSPDGGSPSCRSYQAGQQTAIPVASSRWALGHSNHASGWDYQYAPDGATPGDRKLMATYDVDPIAG